MTVERVPEMLDGVPVLGPSWPGGYQECNVGVLRKRCDYMDMPGWSTDQHKPMLWACCLGRRNGRVAAHHEQ